MNKNLFLLLLAALLIVVGLLKPDLSQLSLDWLKPKSVEVVVEKPSAELVKNSQPVIQALKAHSNRKKDAIELAKLYRDLAILIELDNEDTVIKNTEEIRQANSLSGTMLKLNVKNKYPDLKEASYKFIVSVIGDDIVPLDDELRNKSVQAFKALSWACYEGAK